MSIKIKKELLYEWLLVLLIFFNEHGFYILNNFGYWIEITLLFSSIFWCIYPQYRDTFSRSIVGKFLLLGAVSFSYTLFASLQSTSKAIAAYLYFLIPLVGIPIAQNACITKKIIKNAIKKLSLYISCVFLIQYIVQKRFQIIQYSIYTANGTVRIIVGSFIISIGFLILFTEYIQDIKNIRKLLKTILVGGTIVTVIQSRSIIFGVLVAMLYIVISMIQERVSSNSIFQWRCMEVILVIGIGFVGYRLVRDIISTSYAIKESSSVLRLGGVQYYWKLFLKHPLLGIGKIRNQAIDGLAQWGVRRRYFIDDIGIIGYLAQFGILGMGYFASWVKKTDSAMKKEKNGIAEKAILVFVIVMMPFNMLLNIDTFVLYMILIPVLYNKPE